MPTKPRRPCQHPGCAALAIEGASRCAVHNRVRLDRRPSAARRGYDRDWRRTRAQVIDEQPTCVRCGKPATEVHHLRPLRQGGTHDRANLVSLCHSCHMTIERAPTRPQPNPRLIVTEQRGIVPPVFRDRR